MSVTFDIRTVLVELGDRNRLGMATKRFQDYLVSVGGAIPAYSPIIVPGSGSNNDTDVIQKAVNAAAAQGGSVVVLPPGTFSIGTITFPAGTAPITLAGQGDSTILKRRAVIEDGKGLLDVLGENVTIESLVIDGQVTSPTGLLYNHGFSTPSNANDPMAQPLTKNSSIWVHGGANNFSCYRLVIKSTGGYAALIDSLDAMIEKVRFFDCDFLNNRPHLFGVTAGAEIYGSWSGGVLLQGDGRAENPGRMINQFSMESCRFRRNTGNQVWQHSYGLDNLHRGFQVTGCYFEDIGLDGVLAGAVIGGTVGHNVFHRIGYICETDTDRPIPRWLPSLNATAIDSSGLVIGVNYQGNSIISANGGALDLDGHSDSSLSGNLVRIPLVGDPDYDEDSIGSSGINNAGSTSYGVNLGNTANSSYGGKNVTVTGNTLLNLSVGAVRLYSARNCLVEANNIVAPDAPLYPPISLGPGGPGLNQRSTGNVIKHNRFSYSPAIAAPFCFEDPTIAPFVASDINYVFGNCPIIGASGLATEFENDPSSGSPVYAQTIWF